MAEKLRLRFAKTGRAIYISHLDLMRTMQRAFLRAGYALEYSEGFNPHPKISILLPLGVGCSSQCELMDFSLTEPAPLPELPQTLTRAMPEGIVALSAYPGGRKVRELKWLRIQGSLEYDDRAPEELCPALRAFFGQERIVIRKKTKRGEGESDLVSAIRELRFAPGVDCVELTGVISAQEPTLNPDHLIQALRQLAPELAPDFAGFTRLETYDGEMRVFR